MLQKTNIFLFLRFLDFLIYTSLSYFMNTENLVNNALCPLVHSWCFGLRYLRMLSTLLFILIFRQCFFPSLFFFKIYRNLHLIKDNDLKIFSILLSYFIMFNCFIFILNVEFICDKNSITQLKQFKF